MEYSKNQIVGKYLLEDIFSINGRKHCRVKCLWCGKEFVTQLRHIKKGKGCACKEKSKLYIGQYFGKLQVLGFDGKNVKCQCECGTIKSFLKGNLMSSNTTNCGCEKSKRMIELSTKHNMSKTRIYHIYSHIKSRCYNPKTYAYKWYGALGICMCDEWLGEEGFLNFYNWAINNGYKETLSIERLDINKGYSPENCMWIDMSKQHENTCRTIRIATQNGFCFVKDLSKKYNIPKSTLYAKIRKMGKENLTEEMILKNLKGVD